MLSIIQTIYFQMICYHASWLIISCPCKTITIHWIIFIKLCTWFVRFNPRLLVFSCYFKWYRCGSEWTPGVGDGQGGLACCDSWGCKESDTTERLNRTEFKWYHLKILYFVCCKYRRIYIIFMSFLYPATLLNSLIYSDC